MWSIADPSVVFDFDVNAVDFKDPISLHRVTLAVVKWRKAVQSTIYTEIRDCFGTNGYRADLNALHSFKLKIKLLMEEGNNACLEIVSRFGYQLAEVQEDLRPALCLGGEPVAEHLGTWLSKFRCVLDRIMEEGQQHQTVNPSLLEVMGVAELEEQPKALMAKILCPFRASGRNENGRPWEFKSRPEAMTTEIGQIFSDLGRLQSGITEDMRIFDAHDHRISFANGLMGLVENPVDSFRDMRKKYGSNPPTAVRNLRPEELENDKTQMETKNFQIKATYHPISSHLRCASGLTLKVMDDMAHHQSGTRIPELARIATSIRNSPWISFEYVDASSGERSWDTVEELYHATVAKLKRAVHRMQALRSSATLFEAEVTVLQAEIAASSAFIQWHADAFEAKRSRLP
ncbi:hypothetical protein MKZ38_007291 [Zalerion maritima]|uniref:Uncharacterized protein n=1 Tax=Zalerion maritima TaxID=339359 RepID=A0AAD5RIL5_9PEZI|nr:hypothetical protein MKZ38_007291 [Zalerion maritima]